MPQPTIFGWKEAGVRPAPDHIWTTPVLFRFILAGLGISATVFLSLAVSTALARWLTGDTLAIVVGVLLAVLFGFRVLRYFDPWNPYRWFHLAISNDGLYLPTRDKRIVLVPWSLVGDIEIHRWQLKGEHSLARVRLALDDDVWNLFDRSLVEDGTGRGRQYRIQIVDVDAGVIAKQIEAFRDRSNPNGS